AVPPGGGGGRGGRGGGPGTHGDPAPGDTAVPRGAPSPRSPTNPPQVTTTPGQNPPAPPAQPPAAPPAQPQTTPPGTPPETPAPATTPGQGERGRGTTPPEQPTRVELRNLATGAVKSWQDMQGFVFSPNSTYLAMKRRPANANGGRGGTGNAGGGDQPGGGAQSATANANAAPPGPRGTDVILHNLVTGRDQLLGSVGDIAFNKTGELLAYTVDAAVKDGNGLFVMDLQSGRIHALDNDAKSYNRLTWSDDGKALAVLKGADADKMRERDNVLIAFTD